MSIIVYSTEEGARNAVKKIFVEKVRDALDADIAIRNGNGFVTDISGWTDDEISVLKICGKRKDMVEFDKGLTTEYASIQKSEVSEHWFFPVPEAEYLQYITGYTIIDMPENWQTVVPS